jgi:long-chain acyl-CoA synthetase
LSYGASPMPDALLKRALERFRGIAFLQSYGMTELSPVATMLMPRYHAFEGPDAGYTRSAGQAVFNADVVAMDERDAPVPTGTIGEICVRGPMVMQGYWRQPDLTAQTVRDGWMHTGDAGYIDARGFVFLVDRVKDMIVTGGENVYSAEVENVIYQHPAVHECAVIGVPSEAWGEAVHAIVVPKPNTKLAGSDIIAFCRDRIAHYKAPKSCDVSTQELPKSGAGKIMKAELRKPFWKNAARGIN